MSDRNLKLAIGVLSCLEHAVNAKWKDAIGPMSMIIVISAIIACPTNMHHVLNRVGVSPSYKTIDRVRQRIIATVEGHEKYTLHDTAP